MIVLVSQSVLSPKQKAGLDVSITQRQVHSLAASVMFCVADLRSGSVRVLWEKCATEMFPQFEVIFIS